MKAFYLPLAALALHAVPAMPAPLSVTTGGAESSIRVTVINPNIIRVDDARALSAAGGSDTRSVVALVPQENVARLSEDGATIITNAGIRVDLSDGTICIGGTMPGSTVCDSGIRGGTGGANTITLGTSGTGSFYGAGERGHKFNLAGDTLVMYNRQNYGYTGHDPRISQMNITMPLFLSDNGYAIVFDDYAASELVLTNPIVYTSESPLPVTYYYVGGVDNLADLTEQLTELTGRQPLPPLWALGYITSKYGYRTQAETEGVVDTLRTAGYPLDGIVLDLYWYGKEQDMGRLEWDPAQWPDPRGMMARLDSMGVNTIAISQPYVLRNGRALDNYNSLSEKGLFVADSTGGPQEVKIWVGEGGMFDVSNPATRRWLTERYHALAQMGQAGWWGDLGEPEVHPESGMHHNGLSTRLYHNKYGNDWSSILAGMYAREYPDRRLMTLMRGGTTGLQRYSVFPWSTDVSRSWGGLEPQIRIMLGAGLSGLGYMGSDLGGFAVDPESPYMPELYLRWVQAGLFSPVFRTHAQQYAEPYNYPMYAGILPALVRERYRWLPYNYTLAYENAAYGWPLARPLDFRNNAHGRYDSISDQYLWGDAIMVAPVMTEGAAQRRVVFPDGPGWYDINTGQYYPGGTEAVVDSPLERLPLFVVAGGLFVTADYAMSSTRDYRDNDFTVNVYPHPGCESTATLYDDNRLTPGNIDNGQYRLTGFYTRTDSGTTRISVSSEGTYAGAPDTIMLHFAVHVADKAGVKCGKTNVPAVYADGVLKFDISYTPGNDTDIIIK